MVAVAIPRVITPTSASGAQVIDGSLVIQSSLSQYLGRTFSALGNRKTWTFSAWIKKTSFGSSKKGLFGYDSTNDHIRLQNNDDGGDSMRFLAPSVFDYILSRKDRDIGWFHLVVACDTTQGSASDRVNIYYNGELQTAYYSSSDPSQNADTGFNQAGAHSIGRGGTGGDQAYVDAVLSNVYWIDGTQLESSEFGYTDPLTNTWRPKKFSAFNNPNKGITWSSSLSTNDPGGFGSGYEATKGFDGSLATYAGSDSYANDLTLTFGPTTPLIYNSSVEIITTNSGAATITFNGTSTGALIDTWQTIATGSGSISNSNAIVVDTESTTQFATITAIRVDGYVLLDGAADNSFYLPFDGNSPIGKDQSGRTTINDGKYWSAYITSSTNNFYGDGGVHAQGVGKGFDGDTSTYVQQIGGVNPNYITFTPPSAIPHTSLVEVWLVNAANEVSYNGGGLQTLSSGSWQTVATGSGTLTSLKFERASTSGASFNAIRVDGTTLIDGQEGNSWTPVNFGGSNNIDKATGALPILNTVNGGKVATVGVRKDYSPDTPQWLKDSGAVRFGAWASGTGPLLEASSTLLNITSDTQTFTIEAWIYPLTINAQSPAHDYRFTSIVSQGQVYASFGYVDDGKLRWHTYDGTAHYISSAVDTIVTGQWQHVACVSNGGTVKLYKNGVEVASGTLEDPNGGQSDDIHIGNADLTFQSDAVDGFISNLRITNTAVYTAAFASPTEPLTSISGTQLLCCQSTSSATAATTIATGSITSAGNVVAVESIAGGSCVLALPLVSNALDVSNQINSGSTTKVVTVSGAAAEVEFANFYGSGGSFDFDGSNDKITIAPTNASDFTCQSDFTIEGWIYVDAFTTADAAIFSNWDTGNNRSILVGPDASGADDWVFMYNTTGSGSWTTIANPDATPYLNKWTHIAYSYDHSITTHRAFVDGVLVGTSAVGTPYNNSGANLILGINKGDGSGYFDGKMQDVRYYHAVKYTNDFIPASPNSDILPETPSGVALGSELTKVTDGAVAFGGSGAANPNKYLTVPDSADFTFGTGDFTLEAYVNYSDNTTWSSIIQKYTTDSASSSWFWAIYAGIMKIYIYYGSSQVAVSPTTTFPENAWVHCAVTRDGNTVRLFQNGVLIGTADMTGLTMNDSSVALTIGSDGDTNYDLNGYVSNVRVIKADIPTAYQTTSTTLGTNVFTPPLAPLTDVTNTKLLCCQSNTSAIAAAVTPGTIVATGAVATNFTPFNTDIDIVRGQETGYCTLNPLNGGTKLTLSDGNLTATGATGHACAGGTIYVSGGKWYWEAYMRTVSTTYSGVGMARVDYNIGSGLPGYDTDKSFIMYSSAGAIYYNSTGTVAYGTSWTTGDMIGCRYDDGYCYFYKNNVLMNASPVSAATLTSGYWTPVFQSFGDGVWDINFGQKPFRYTPPEGHQPINDANLPSPGVVRSDQYVGVTTYPGNGATQFISPGNFSPDMVWMKGYDEVLQWRVVDTVRGQEQLNCNSDAVSAAWTSIGWLPGQKGYNITDDGSEQNKSGFAYLSYGWKAGGNPGISTTAFWKDDKEYASASAAGLTGDSELFLQDEVYSSVLEGYSSAHGSQFQSGAEAVKAFNGTIGSAWNQGASPLGGGSDTYIRFTPSSQVATNTVSVYINYHMDVSFYTGSPGSSTKVAGPFSTSTSAYFTKVDCGTVPAWDYVQMQVDEPASYSAYLGGIEIGGKLLVDSNVTAPGVPTLTPTSASIGTKPGFSIIKYRGNGTSGATIAHGLSQTPDFFIIKSTIYQYNWNVYHQAMGNTHLIRLNTNASEVTESGAAWNDTSPTSSLITFGNLGGTNMNTAEYMAYIWHDVPGLQKFGEFDGNSSADGPFIELGFSPAIVIIRKYNTGTNDWYLFDDQLNKYNLSDQYVCPNLTNAKTPYSNVEIDMLSNGFKIRNSEGSLNAGNMLYAAWAKSPMNNLFGGQSNAR